MSQRRIKSEAQIVDEIFKKSVRNKATLNVLKQFQEMGHSLKINPYVLVQMNVYKCTLAGKTSKILHLQKIGSKSTLMWSFFQ